MRETMRMVPASLFEFWPPRRGFRGRIVSDAHMILTKAAGECFVRTSELSCLHICVFAGHHCTFPFQLDRVEEGKVGLHCRIIHPGGEIRDLHAVAHPVLGPSGDLVEFVGSIIDVTERKWAEEERERLLQTQAYLAHFNRVTTMGELAASLAHEVKQPIAATVINAKTCLRWLQRDEPDLSEACAAATRILRDGKLAGEIIGRIRTQFEKGDLKRELVDVNEIIREMIVLLRQRDTTYQPRRIWPPIFRRSSEIACNCSRSR
jgi:hypothetical protein